jgi:transposase
MEARTMEYIGVDAHKAYCVASVVNGKGKLLCQERFESTPEAIRQFFSRRRRGSRAVLESTSFYEPIYEAIERLGFDVRLSHPKKTRAIALAKVKTDKVDSLTLAQLLRADLIPEAWVPPREVRDLRNRVRSRVYLKRKETSVKNRTYYELTRRGIPYKPGCLATKRGRLWVRELGLQDVGRLIDLLDLLGEHIVDLEADLLQEYNRNEDAQRIATIPGIGFYGAMLIAAEVGNVSRFPDAEHLCAYAGIVPTVHQSSDVDYRGRITKEGSPHLRWILTEAVHLHVRHAGDTDLQRFHRRLARRRGKKKAVVATTRKMLTAIYHMLRNRESYNPHPSRSRGDRGRVAAA